MGFPQRHSTDRQFHKLSRSTSTIILIIAMTVAAGSLALMADRFRANAAQDLRLIQISEEPVIATGVAYYQPANALLLSGAGRAELFDAASRRSLFSASGIKGSSRITAALESRNGFTAGEIFAGEEAAGKIARISTDGTRTEITLPGELGLVSDLVIDPTGVFGGDLIAVTTEGGVWRVDATHNSQRATPLVAAKDGGGEISPIHFGAVAVAPNESEKYGSWAGKILAASSERIYTIDLSGAVGSFDLGIGQINDLLPIREGENFYGIAIDHLTGIGMIWGAPAAAFAGMAGDLLVTQTPHAHCDCVAAIWRVRWNGAEFQKTRLAEISGVENPERLIWGQTTFSPFIANSLQQQNQAIPVVGPFDRPAAEGSPGNNNDDFTLNEPLVQAANNATIAKQDVTFVNTLKNIGNVKGNFIVSAQAIPPGFSVSATFDQSNGFTSLNNGGILLTSREPDPNEQFNIEILISAPAGTAVKTNFDVVIQVTSATDATKFNRTIDRINFIPLTPPLLLGPFGNPEAVGPTGNNDDFTRARINFQISNGQTTEPGQVRFINTLKNAGAAPARFVITAPTIPQGFSVKVSVDSGESFVSLDQAATAVIPTLVNPGESRNLDVRISLSPGLVVGVDYDVLLQASREDAPANFNRTIDRVRPDPNPPNLALAKGVRDLSGQNLDGKTVLTGQTIEYTLTLRNQSNVAVAKSFIAEYLPPDIAYVANSVQITAGPNGGAKTDRRGDDQVDYFPSAFVNGQINIFTGAGAAPDRGGTLAPGESTTIVFRVTVDQNAARGTVIRNGADWGAEDFAVGGRSNVVAVTVGAPACTPPAITTQPASQIITIGQSVTFIVAAVGTELKYQWRKNGAAIPGATVSSFTIAATAFSDAGNYDVIVTGACGSVTSSIASLALSCQTITVGPATIAAGKVGTAYSQTFTQSGAASFSINTLPPGLNFNTVTGVLSGTPTQAGAYSLRITAMGANGCAAGKTYTLTIEPDAGPPCQTLCFRSAGFFSLNFNLGAIPRGAVLIGGINANNPIPSTDQRVRQALDGRLGELNREYVAAQLNVLNASGLGAGNVITALAAQLRCSGLDFSQVTVGNGALTLTPEKSLFDLIVYVNSAVKGSVSSRDVCVLAKLLNGLNGNNQANICHRQTGPIDFANCN